MRSNSLFLGIKWVTEQNRAHERLQMILIHGIYIGRLLQRDHLHLQIDFAASISEVSDMW